jgi:hypothetical protein
MDFSPRVLLIVGLSVVFRLATLYLGRLDSREADDPAGEGRAIAASRRRAQGHLWLLGVLMASISAPLVLFGVEQSPIDAWKLLAAGALATAAALCFHRMLAAYRDARRILSARSAAPG